MTTLTVTPKRTRPYPALFLRCRAAAFGLITLGALAWLGLLCTVSFIEWDISDHAKKALLLMLIVTNSITLITLPILIIRDFRPWLDAIRLLLLCALHIAAGALFTYWAPKSPCPARKQGGMGRCELFNLLSIIAAWVMCALLIAYACGLALMGHYRRQILHNAKSIQPASSSTSELIKERDVEAAPPTPASSFYPATPTTMRPYSLMPTPRSVNVPQPVVIRSPPRYSMSASISPPNTFPGDVSPPQVNSRSQAPSRKSYYATEPTSKRVSIASRTRSTRVPVPPFPGVIAEQKKTNFMDSGDNRFNGVNQGRFSRISRVSGQPPKY